MSLLHQATCVAIRGRALLIEGAPGSGKSSLALQLIDRGATLIGDDGVNLEPSGTRLYASPPPHIAGKLEVRNLGLFDFQTVSRVPVALVLRLDGEAPRFIDLAETIDMHGIVLPMVRVWPDCSAIKAELALRRYGV